MDDNTTTVLLALIAAVASVLTGVIAAYGARKADGAKKTAEGAASQAQEANRVAERLEVKVNGRVDELLGHAVARARAEGVIAGAAASGDRRSAGLPAVIGEPSMVAPAPAVPLTSSTVTPDPSTSNPLTMPEAGA